MFAVQTYGTYVAKSRVAPCRHNGNFPMIFEVQQPGPLEIQKSGTPQLALVWP